MTFEEAQAAIVAAGGKFVAVHPPDESEPRWKVTVYRLDHWKMTGPEAVKAGLYMTGWGETMEAAVQSALASRERAAWEDLL